MKSTISEYMQFVSQMYKSSSHLFFGETLLRSESGVQQGDPLGPLLFCLVIKPMTELISSRLNLWYLDDGALGGDPEDVRDDLVTIMKESEKLGLSLNLSKCEILTTAGTGINAAQCLLDVSDNLKTPSRSEYVLLGSPLTDEAISDVVEEKKVIVSRLVDRLSILGSHQALFLLKNCLSLPKLLYIMRTEHVYQFEDLLRSFDEIIRTSLSKVTNIAMTEPVWRQASLPVRHGGLGIRRTEQLALPAYLASAHFVLPLIKEIYPTFSEDETTTDALFAWSTYMGPEIEIPAVRSVQRIWDEPI